MLCLRAACVTQLKNSASGDFDDATQQSWRTLCLRRVPTRLMGCSTATVSAGLKTQPTSTIRQERAEREGVEFRGFALDSDHAASR